MAKYQERNEDRLDGPLNTISFVTRTSSKTSVPTTTAEDELGADLDEPPEKQSKLRVHTEFHRSVVKPTEPSKPSLLTKALLNSPDSETFIPRLSLPSNIARPMSIASETSSASSMELTSDGDLTSPARTNTPSPPFSNNLNKHMASLYLEPTSYPRNLQSCASNGPQDAGIIKPAVCDVSVETLAKKRCITFACGGKTSNAQLPVKQSGAISTTPDTPSAVSDDNRQEPPKRTCSIKFACPAAVQKPAIQSTQPVKPAEVTSSGKNNQSPTTVRKTRTTSSPRPPQSRRTSRSPLATRRKRPIFLTSSSSTEATRFHEFASGEVEEDDWICRDSSENKTRITINDTLKKENAIRKIGREAEEEAMQEEEDGDEEDDQPEDSDAEIRDDFDESDIDFSDGNETDNEAGFADSDEESDGEEYQFWTPSRAVAVQASTYRASAHRTTSESSIDSPRCMSPSAPWADVTSRPSRPRPARRDKFRPGTPDLPDSTDFVCGTLDEDRPLEEAYLSCMEVRKRERHRAIPQDIDPSFPTSDPENDDDDEHESHRHDSDDFSWMHGKFEESDEHNRTSRRPRTKNSSLQSPKRMHSPPPKMRLRSPPPPRRPLGGASPRRLRSPLPTHQVTSVTTSPASPSYSGAITFTPLGPRPGLTHTKSLPRAPGEFCKQYRAARLAIANADIMEEETTDGYTRGAIDIVMGLERKRQHRKEKLLRKQTNRARKIGPERRPQPGKGAERMRELGLHMAGKGGANKAEYVLSV